MLQMDHTRGFAEGPAPCFYPSKVAGQPRSDLQTDNESHSSAARDVLLHAPFL